MAQSPQRMTRNSAADPTASPVPERQSSQCGGLQFQLAQADEVWPEVERRLLTAAEQVLSIHFTPELKVAVSAPFYVQVFNQKLAELVGVARQEAAFTNYLKKLARPDAGCPDLIEGPDPCALCRRRSAALLIINNGLQGLCKYAEGLVQPTVQLRPPDTQQICRALNQIVRQTDEQIVLA